MSDIVKRLRQGSLTRDDYRWEAADEITRLEARVAELHERLEIDPEHPYDGIDCRDETIRQQDLRVARLEARVKELEEALTWTPSHRRRQMTTEARAALVEKVAKAICQERCAFMGEPPCWSIAAAIEGEEFPAPDCNDPGCEALAEVAIRALLKEK